MRRPAAATQEVPRINTRSVERRHHDIREVHVGPGTFGVFDWVAETPNPK